MTGGQKLIWAAVYAQEYSREYNDLLKEHLCGYSDKSVEDINPIIIKKAIAHASRVATTIVFNTTIVAEKHKELEALESTYLCNMVYGK